MNNIKLIFLSIIFGFGGAFLFQKFFNDKAASVTYITESVQKPSFASSHSFLDSEVNFVSASAASTQCVVYIKTSSSQFVAYDWFDLFFSGGSAQQVVVSSGSGVIYSSDGYIITNNHVIENAEQVEVIHNKRSYKAKVIGRDPSSDLAVLKIEANKLPAIKLSSSKDALIGDWVLAVGNPFNLESTVTAGIISAKGRNINIVKDRFPIESFIQTDAAINPGNSGGALVNLKGELIGINTAILSNTGQYAGYGFAVPVDIAKKIADDLIKYGEVQKAFLGADVVEVTDETAKKAGISELNGVAISKIMQDGAADKVGMQQGDIIIEINGTFIKSKSNFDEEISYCRPGDKIKIKFVREGKTIESAITLTNIEGTTELLKREIFYSSTFGVELETVSKLEKSRLGIDYGVRVVNMDKGGVFNRMDIEQGFIITGINNKKIKSPTEIPSILGNIRGRVVIEGISKNGQRGYYSFYF
ncbi:MAG: trypsin-like peptidase domain-containing protein [Bacteroidota bacterium]|nr:trypsin-like peptidase domain-containing protein [Bacteroidota bacterium]